MKNDEYWQKRAEQRLIESEQIAARAEKEMKKAFDAAYKDIELQIYKLYGKYAKDNELSYADTLAYLTDNEHKEFQKDLSFYIAKAKDGNYRKEYRAYLQALSVRARVKRLEAYQAQLKVIAEQLYEEQIIPQATAVMQTVTLDSYLKAAFDISQGVGLLMAFDMPSQRIIDHVLQYPWSGKSFSQKWIDNCADFESILDQVLTKGLVAGSSNQKIARELADKTGQAYNRALRLVRTETNYAHGQAAKAMYEQLGVEEYRFEATLDIKTSKICRSLDGQKFLVKDFTPGVNANAMHPWCRSTTTPVVYEDRIGTRAARDKDGKKYNVPGNMTYEQWYDKYVKTDPEYLKVEKMYKNQWADRKQYEQYKSILRGKHIPKSFEKFQNMKYNDADSWDFLKLDYRRRKELIDHPELQLPNAEHVIIADEKFSRYLFNPDNPKGIAKGKAIISRLGYDANNYKVLKKTIASQAIDYPATVKQKDEYGVRYEQKMVVYGVNGKPANLVVGWNVKDGETKMTSTYIKEVK